MSTLQFAIKMELDGEKYYQEQAAENKEGGLGKVFTFLAKAEHKHAQLIEKCADGQTINLDQAELANVKNVFTDLEAYKTDVTSVPRQLEAYEFARGLEQKSIDLYTDLLSQSSQSEEKDLLEFLINQEKQHYALFEQLTEMVRNAEEWVEDAEFGNRDEY